MKILSLFAFMLCIFGGSYLPQELSRLSIHFHKICKEVLPVNSLEVDTLSSLVCGEKVTDQKRLKSLRMTGLIHIFVVSGGHLIFLSEILNHLRWPLSLRFCFLSFFTLFTGFQIPCVRSLMQFSVGELLKSSKHSLRNDQKVFLCGVILLMLSSDLVSSLSLQLSWGAALALAINQQLAGQKSFLIRTLTGSLLVYLMMYPLLSLITGLHPLSILWNISLGTLATVVLFPLCGLAMLNSLALKLVDSVMPLFWRAVEAAHSMTSSFSQLSWVLLYGWIWILFWHGAAHIFLVSFHRKHST